MLGLMLNGSLAAVASVSHPGALLLTPSTPPASELLGEVLIDGSTSSAAQPRNATTVYCGAEIRVDGVAIKQSDLHGDIQVVRSWDQRLQTFSFSVVLKTPTGPLGSPFRKAGPATCVKTIDIDGILETPTGVHRVPLIRNGIVTSDGRSTGPPWTASRLGSAATSLCRRRTQMACRSPRRFWTPTVGASCGTGTGL